jgi:hypothetical protein
VENINQFFKTKLVTNGRHLGAYYELNKMIMGDWNRVVESCKEATGRTVEDNWDVMEVVDELSSKIGRLEQELSKLRQDAVSNRREQLIAYELKLWINPTKEQIEIAEKIVDMYLSD